MSIVPYQNGGLSIQEKEVLFLEEQCVQSVAILLQGGLDVLLSPYDNLDIRPEAQILKESFRIFSLEQSIFLGAGELLCGARYPFTCQASENSNLYILLGSGPDDAKSIISAQKDYGAHMMTSLAGLVCQSHDAFQGLRELCGTLRLLAGNLSLYFWDLKERFGFSITPSDTPMREALDDLQKLREKGIQFPEAFSPAVIEQLYPGIYEPEYDAGSSDPTLQEYYVHLLKLPGDLRKSFFSADSLVTGYQLQKAFEYLAELQSSLKELIKSAQESLLRLYGPDGESLFHQYVLAARECKKNRIEATPLFDAVRYTASRLQDIYHRLLSDYAYTWAADPAIIDSMASLSDAGESRHPGIEERADIDIQVLRNEAENLPEELRDSADRILEYSNIPREQAEQFRTGLHAFRKLKDRLSADADIRSIRNSVSSVFFDLYQAVFKRVLSENNTSRLYHMFLKFTYMDECLLKSEDILTLYRLVDRSQAPGCIEGYNIRDWLMKINRLEKDPSIDEFGQDYFDIFREMKKAGRVTDRDKAEYEQNTEKRLHHEIHKMLKVNQRLCHGHTGVYFPILHSEMITKDLSKAIITPEALQQSLDRILQVDFSAFHREVSYRNAETKVEKEFIMKAVMPDIILMPTFGTRATMWQEITGRSRSTPGRFILPAFTGENLDDMMIKLVGNFRWELCRTMMGVGWNDVSQKSLTSEYSDYIQFYRKNHDLSEEAKEKVKSQIQKHHSRLRDIFTADYEAWISHEARGVIRLNKIARSILYRYCPLSKPLREQLSRQPIYAETGAKFQNLRAKQAREIGNRYARLEKSGIELDQDLLDNLRFYRDL